MNDIAMKTSLLVLVDTCKSMNDSISIEKSTYSISKLDLAKQFLCSHVTKIMSSKTMDFGIVSYRCKETDNYLNSNQGAYNHVVNNLDPTKPTQDSISIINSIKYGNSLRDTTDDSDIEGGIIDALGVGMDILVRTTIGKKNKIMLVITDCESMEGNDQEDFEFMEELKKQIINNNITIYFLCLGKVSDELSNKYENCKFLKSIAEETGGSLMQANTIIDCFYLLAQKPGLGTKPTMPKVNLIIYPDSKPISCQLWAKIQKKALPSLKKKINKPGQVDVDHKISRDFSYFDNESKHDLPAENRLRGYKYGQQYVPVNNDDNFKIKGESEIHILGFMNQDKIPRNHYLSATQILQFANTCKNVENTKAQTSICALSRALRQEQCVGIARVSIARVGCVTPYLASISAPSSDDGTLIVHRLPCKDDCREYVFPSLPSNNININQKEIMNNMVNLMTIGHTNEQKLTKRRITPIHIPLFGVMQTIQRSLFDIKESNFDYQELDPFKVVSCLDNINEANYEKSMLCLEKLNKEFPLKKVEKRIEKRKTFWSDLRLNDSVDNKKSKLEVDIDNTSTMDSFSTIHVDESINSVIPSPPSFNMASTNKTEDFEKLIEYHSKYQHIQTGISDTIETMEDIIESLAENISKSAYKKQVLSCMKSLRGVSISKKMSLRYNEFLKKLQIDKDSLTTEINLISNLDDISSTVSEEEAIDFLLFREESSILSTNIPIENNEGEEEDLFADLE